METRLGNTLIDQYHGAYLGVYIAINHEHFASQIFRAINFRTNDPILHYHYNFCVFNFRTSHIMLSENILTTKISRFTVLTFSLRC